MSHFLKKTYLADGFRELLLDQIGPEQSKITAELIEWLVLDRGGAIARGFSPAYRRLPLRPLPDEQGTFVAIPWDQVQALIRELLRRITGERGPQEQGVDAIAMNTFWTDWWQLHSRQPRWYRSAPSGASPPVFHMESERGK